MMASDRISVEVAGLCKTYDGKTAAENISFSVKPGEIFGFLGPNGAGKTTILHMVAGVLEPDRGQIRLHGKPFSFRSVQERASIGLVPQDLALYPELTVRENLRFFAGLYGVREPALKLRINEVVESCDLSDCADQLAHTLSGGKKRKLNLALGLIHRPSVLILDEPTVGIDIESRIRILEDIRKQARQGVSVVYATHYLEEIRALGGRISILNRGRLVGCFDVSEFLDDEPEAIELVVRVSDPKLLSLLEGWVAVSATVAGEFHLLLKAGSPTEAAASLNDCLLKVFCWVRDCDADLLSFKVQQRSVESIYSDLMNQPADQ